MVLICCFALTNAAILGTDNSPATAVSYSSIRFGTSTIEKNSGTVKFALTPEYLTTQKKPNIFNENPTITFKTLDTMNSDTKKFEASSNDAYTVPAKAIYPQYVPSRSRILNFANPISSSRNIPLTPSPEFDSVPSVLKTEGLSAYASFPIEISAPQAYTSTMVAKGLSSSMFSVKLPTASTISY